MKLSIIIPCYNEEATIQKILFQVQSAAPQAEIIIVDDGSTDQTRRVLENLPRTDNVITILHAKNLGKGGAIQTGIKNASGEIILIQDADLEYDPRDYPTLLLPILEDRADVVYGSRFLGSPHRAMMFWHMVANKILTFMTNVLYDTILTDMETGYKVFKSSAIKNIPLKANRFDFEPEITAKILKRKLRIYEVPITFNPREYSEGKKIGLKDAFEAVAALIKYRFVD
ncbi:MAG TPA: glycosyltransferase family 2 protein [Anaerolineales bacterium]|nr:glycosyltransferase family 2 protein [Anaerolineales bacterium]